MKVVGGRQAHTTIPPGSYFEETLLYDACNDKPRWNYWAYSRDAPFLDEHGNPDSSYNPTATIRLTYEAPTWVATVFGEVWFRGLISVDVAGQIMDFCSLGFQFTPLDAGAYPSLAPDALGGLEFGLVQNNATFAMAIPFVQTPLDQGFIVPAGPAVLLPPHDVYWGYLSNQFDHYDPFDPPPRPESALYTDPGFMLLTRGGTETDPSGAGMNWMSRLASIFPEKVTLEQNRGFFISGSDHVYSMFPLKWRCYGKMIGGETNAPVTVDSGGTVGDLPAAGSVR